jgi:hypothetical protein
MSIPVRELTPRGSRGAEIPARTEAEASGMISGLAQQGRVR